MKKNPISLFIACLLVLPIGSLLHADEVTMKNGSKVTCVVIAKDETALIAETAYGTITLKRDAVASVRADTPEKNYILRGDFYKAKGKLDQAIKYYGEAMVENPKSKEAAEKYKSARKEQEAFNKNLMLSIAKADANEPQVTEEDVTGAKAKKKLGGKESVSLQAEGIGVFPVYVPKGENKDNLAFELARRIALNKIYPHGVGIGFQVSGDRVDILPEGELPNCNIQITKKEKTAVGYKVTVQISGPADSVLVNMPKDYPVTECTGQTEDIKAKTQTEVQLRALNDAYVQGIKQAAKDKVAANPKLKNKKLYGRLYLDKIDQESLTPLGYLIKAKVKIWFDPTSES